MIQEKEGDVMVHLGGIVAFWMSGLAGPIAERLADDPRDRSGVHGRDRSQQVWSLSAPPWAWAWSTTRAEKWAGR